MDLRMNNILNELMNIQHVNVEHVNIEHVNVEIVNVKLVNIDRFADEGSRRLPKRLNYCFSVLASETNRSI